MQIKSTLLFFLATVCSLLLSGCFGDIYVFSEGPDPLKEVTLSGGGFDKVLVIPVYGTISLDPVNSLLKVNNGVVQEVVSQLEKAEEDNRVKSVVLLINSPGGSVTASDVLYQELLRFKERTGKKLYVSILDCAASGGYYIALPADGIYAHPTSLTGSVGVIFMRPEISGLMKIVGVRVNTSKSGKFKDMGSPFKTGTPEEDALFDKSVRTMAEQFTDKVQLHRKISPEQMNTVADARILTADEALSLGLIDGIAYLKDVLDTAKGGTRCKVVAYRREKKYNDNPYIMEATASSDRDSMKTAGVLGQAVQLHAGFYFLWPAVIP